MPTVAAPVITAEMKEWTALGGGNSGIVGNAAHDYGFHIGARYLSSSDYSRRRDPNGNDGPYVDWDYACAGDFSHKNKESLRKRHRRVLNRLMKGELPMICEFIGKPWADRPVYYWARWNGIQTLQRYTGAGHDHWSHISWYRSKVSQRAYLWRETDVALSDSDIKKVALEVWRYKNTKLTTKDAYAHLRESAAEDKMQATLAGIQSRVAALEKLIIQLAQSDSLSLTDEQAALIAQQIAEASDASVKEVLDRLAIAGSAFKGETSEPNGE